MIGRLVFLGGALAVAGVGLWSFVPDSTGATRIVQIKLPELAGLALRGQARFRGFCADCHGENADGVDGAGPPLVHKIYEPSHHGDTAFYRAALSGVRQHHWTFGDMMPVPDVVESDVTAIIAYVRALQRANGIH